MPRSQRLYLRVAHTGDGGSRCEQQRCDDKNSDREHGARSGKIAPTDLQGGCFSISSLGGIGGNFFTPIINAPEVAILGVGKAAMKPVWNGKEFAPRLMVPLSLSYDHRVIDGALGARFISYLAGVLTDIRKLIL